MKTIELNAQDGFMIRQVTLRIAAAEAAMGEAALTLKDARQTLNSYISEEMLERGAALNSSVKLETKGVVIVAVPTRSGGGDSR